MSTEVKITLLKNGPMKVEGATTLQLLRPDGTPVDTQGKAEIYLCRCGHSANKPFCDGGHNRNGWKEG
jgi:CDGSH-type Zn-finger protein